MVIDAGARIGRLAGLLILVGGLGCGPEVDDGAQVHQPRVCGQAGPVELVSFEGDRDWASVVAVEDRWLLLAGGAGPEQGFESYTIDPCGGAPVPLPENAWPVVIGDRLFGCDVNDGSLRSIDSRTGALGEEIDRGLQCDSVAGGPEFALFRRVDSGRLVSVTADGQVRPTELLMASTAETSAFSHLESLSAFLYATFEPRQVAYADGPLLLDDDDTLWHVGLDQSTRVVSQDVAAFLVVEDVVILQRLDDAGAERFEPSLVSLIDGMQREAPEVTKLHVEGGYLFTPDGFFDPVTGVTHPLPEGLRGSPRVVWPETSMAYSLKVGQQDGLQVWDIETGRMLIDWDGEYGQPASVNGWNDAVVLSLENRDGMPELWSFPLDGDDPERVYLGTDRGMSLLGPDEVLSFAGEGPTDVTHHDLVTGEERIVMRDVVSHIVQVYASLLDEPVFEGGRPGFYIVEREGRAVLMMTLLPERG